MACGSCQARAAAQARGHMVTRATKKNSPCMFTVEQLQTMVETTDNMSLKSFAQSQINVYQRDCNMFSDQIKYYHDIVV